MAHVSTRCAMALHRGCGLNPGASVLAAALGQARQPYCGTVVFTGGADAAGRALGMTERVAGRSAAGGRPRVEERLLATSGRS